jgi:hypothetical protein
MYAPLTLKRGIQHTAENPVATGIQRGDNERSTLIKVGYSGDELTFEKSEA